MTHTPRIVFAALAGLTLSALSPPARSMPPFGVADSRVRQVFCDLSAVGGKFSA
jgi:hypothetical protein